MLTTQYHADALANDFVLFCNDVRRVAAWRDLFAHGPPVSALTINPSERSLESIVDASRSIVLAGSDRHADAHLWLFLANGLWRDDTRLTNYWKIWKRLEREGVEWPESKRGPEIAIRSHKSIRYASTGLVEATTYDAAMTINFQLMSVSFMLVSGDQFLSESSVRQLFDIAFSRRVDDSPETEVDWGRLIQSRAARGDVIVKRAGLFNEFAWSVDLFARPDVLLPFFDRVRHRHG